MHRKGGWESSVGTEHVEYETESRVVVLGQSTIALNGGMHPLVRLSHADLLNPREVQVDLEDRVTARFEATAFHATEADMQRVVISGFRSTCKTVQGHKTTSGECPSLRAARAPIATCRALPPLPSLRLSATTTCLPLPPASAPTGRCSTNCSTR